MHCARGQARLGDSVVYPLDMTQPATVEIDAIQGWVDAHKGLTHEIEIMEKQLPGLAVVGASGDMLRRRTQRVCGEVRTDLDALVQLPGPQIEELRRGVEELRGASVNLANQTHPGMRQNLEVQAWTALAVLERRWTEAFAALVLRGRRRDLEAQAETVFDEMREKADALDVMKKQLDAAFPHAMVQAQQRHFQLEMIKHEKLAGRWLCASAFSLGLVFCAAAAAFWLGLPEGLFDRISAIAAKLVIISGLYYLLVACVKNYRAHRHLAVSYEQRKNSIGTFQAFVDAAKDIKDNDETRKAILLATTSAIFTPVATGYSTDQPDPTPMQAVEVIKAKKT